MCELQRGHGANETSPEADRRTRNVYSQRVNKMPPRQWNIGHATTNFLSFDGRCASILAENQVDQRESMKHENYMLVGWKRTRPPTEWHLGRVAPRISRLKSQRSLLPS